MFVWREADEDILGKGFFMSGTLEHTLEGSLEQGCQTSVVIQ